MINLFLLNQKPRRINQNQIRNRNQEEEEEEGFTLIEYAVFFGSIKIFHYLQRNDVTLTPSLWLFAIHGQNSEMIHFLEDNHVELEDESYTQIFYESIKCHHNNLANYFISNFLQNNEEVLYK